VRSGCRTRGPPRSRVGGNAAPDMWLCFGQRIHEAQAGRSVRSYCQTGLRTRRNQWRISSLTSLKAALQSSTK
jgi:hypothetical protein